MGKGAKKTRLKQVTAAEQKAFESSVKRLVPEASTSSVATANVVHPSAQTSVRSLRPEVSSPASSSNAPPTVPTESTNASHPDVPLGKHPKLKHGASSYMLPFLGTLFVWVKYLFRFDYDERIGKPCSCGLKKRTIRCTDCFFPTCLCDTCFMDAHRSNPTHWAEVWDNRKGHFVRRDMCQLGFVINIGHEGDVCRHASKESDVRWFTLVDINGIHRTRVAFCKCNSSVNNFDLLLTAGIFPATVDNPETGFTYALLDLYNLETLVSKKSAFDICNALRRRTNPDFPDEPPDVYVQFLRVMRVWRALQMYKQSGQGHNIDEIMEVMVPGWQKRSLIVPCFACPQRGFNMEEEVLEEDEMKHLETLYLSADGHFGLQRKLKTDDPDDVALTEDMGLFPERDQYEQYMKSCPATTEKTTCANLKAAQMQNKAKFSGCVTSGIVGITCARHSVFQRGGMVDLTSGERFGLTDYALAGVLATLLLVSTVVLTYDIACQYHVNLVRRFTENLFETPFAGKNLETIVGAIVCLVPKLHLQGHIANCQYRYSLNFTKFMGRTCGEGIEGTWAEAKQAGGMTREMNAGHRIDTLNALQNDWNLMKMHKLVDSLFTKLKHAKATANRKLLHYTSLSKQNGQARVEKWLQLSTEPVLNGKEVESVYRMKESKIPGQDKVLKGLLEREVDENEALDRRSKALVSLFINKGLKLQSQQRNVQNLLQKPDQTPTEISEANRQQLSLRGSIDKWRSEQQQHCPTLMDLVLDQDFAHPETEKLYLPSDFIEEERKTHGLQQLTDIELRLRKGEANDALRCLRSALRDRKTVLTAKNKPQNYVVGTQRNLRALDVVRQSQDKVAKQRDKYVACRKAMISLGLSDKDSMYPELKDEDMWNKNVVDFIELGESSIEDSWLWRSGDVGSMSKEEKTKYDEEESKVRWFRARAELERWQEEVEILGEEFRRSARGFEKMAAVWSEVARKSASLSPGHEAYANRQADAFTKRAAKARLMFGQAGGTWPGPGVRLADHVKAERPSWIIDWKGLGRSERVQLDEDEAEELERNGSEDEDQ
ncbi:hypothetical protein VKT23_015315 [Stygiomarasmius scandens]|uniref:CxC2-like cysteine cluster KDZ transposase-associated domain-containing protein n=1 Tax=Marasmiellus scandens TaxID=2682957 RepID=A0ABR1J2H7_9AGAR